MSAHALNLSVAAVLWLAMITYAVLAGADFGGGVWDLLATGPRARDQRRAVSVAMGPVWEANHVWLIFMITGLFTAFPVVFSRLAVGLYLPFTLILFGIVLRGAAFAFRAHGAGEDGQPSAWGTAFGIASAITPFLLGACAGSVASSRVPAEAGPAALFAVWVTPFTLTCGALALAICAGLAAAYLAVEQEAVSQDLAEDFRRRALGAGAAALVFAVLALVTGLGAAPGLIRGLLAQALPLTALAFAAAAVAAAAMLRRRYLLARTAAVAQVALVLLAWAAAQYPVILPPDLTLDGTASPPESMALLLGTFVVGALLLVPSLILLFRVFKGRNPAAGRAVT
ncbi:MAG: cytochrome bd ubiquinol oxidase subunit [Chloroflexota bacterium]|jgi:cytochrome d ubiquinol oxidase subunit II|nr:cytochrome bd ubiquinol oxidase subunit [Chloroflexota bacterium]